MINLNKLPTILTLLIALSVATERLVEITKGIVPWLDTAKADSTIEGRRRAALQFLAVVGGVVIAVLAWPIIEQVIPTGQNRSAATLALGLLSSGGSGFWNTILTYVLKVKDLKELEANQAQARSVAPGFIPIRQPLEGSLKP